MVKTYSEETLTLVNGLTDDQLYTPAEVAESGVLKVLKPSSVRINMGKKMRNRFLPIGKAYKNGYGPAYYGYQYKAAILGVPLNCPSHLEEKLSEETFHELLKHARSRGMGINEAVVELLESFKG